MPSISIKHYYSTLSSPCHHPLQTLHRYNHKKVVLAPKSSDDQKSIIYKSPKLIELFKVISLFVFINLFGKIIIYNTNVNQMAKLLI